MADANAIHELRSYWEFSAVCQFLHLFHESLKIEEFDTDELESQLTSPYFDANLVSLHIRLLKSLVGRPSSGLINEDNWEQFLLKEFAKHLVDQDVFVADAQYRDLPLRNKVLVLHNLCEWQCNYPDRLRVSVNASPDEEIEWRVEPVGYDAKGNTYWLFDDNRLYREAPDTAASKKPPKKGKRKSIPNDKPQQLQSNWSLECSQLHDWESFPERFKKTRSAVEKEFYEFLTSELLPKIIPDLQQKEKQRKLQEALQHRKRSSRLQLREMEKEEQERQETMKRQREAREAARQMEVERRERDELARQRRIEHRERRIAERQVKLSVEPFERDSSYPVSEGSTAGSTGTPTRTTRSKRKRQQNADRWYFDCLCGVHGENLDDGTPMIACGRCGVWQHITCLATSRGDRKQDININEWEQAEFICSACDRAKKLKREREVQDAESGGMPAPQQIVRPRTAESGRLGNFAPSPNNGDADEPERKSSLVGRDDVDAKLLALCDTAQQIQTSPLQQRVFGTSTALPVPVAPIANLGLYTMHATRKSNDMAHASDHSPAQQMAALDALVALAAAATAPNSINASQQPSAQEGMPSSAGAKSPAAAPAIDAETPRAPTGTPAMDRNRPSVGSAHSALATVEPACASSALPEAMPLLGSVATGAIKAPAASVMTNGRPPAPAMAPLNAPVVPQPPSMSLPTMQTYPQSTASVPTTTLNSLTAQLPALGYPHPASPAYYQPYVGASALPLEYMADVKNMTGYPNSTSNTANAAAFFGSLAAGYIPSPGPAAVESFPAPISLVPQTRVSLGQQQHQSTPTSVTGQGPFMPGMMPDTGVDGIHMNLSFSENSRRGNDGSGSRRA